MFFYNQGRPLLGTQAFLDIPFRKKTERGVQILIEINGLGGYTHLGFG
jgi:hypothetical protein